MSETRAKSHANIILIPNSLSLTFSFHFSHFSSLSIPTLLLDSGRPKKIPLEAMVLESIVSRSPSFRRQKDELGSCSTLVNRHRFLLVALCLLLILCTVYLYFAITLGAADSCSGLSGDAKASCQMEHLKDSMVRRKFKLC
ncbi:hypothetical protein PIB30_083301 [Stylosanthes scabra]|uniref:Uncharacterized protein n=1 Tax=Stylosanthes scabra TaxID=79078 RepID=A0ABU6WVH7_9FABA|nr:hypothetical protein [Stylosanthes scabra]